ncbi:MAG TPA: GNAT family N-acetyltransferase [Candidatus Deferrimicrobiaceae bacterium]|jgi:CelD/BcsL family acetyltransferase involved in cellulose biosynthesis
MPISWLDRATDIEAGEWRSVHERSAARSPFLSPSFLLPWEIAFASGRRRRIARWESSGVASGFLFLCERGDEYPGWELMGGTDVADILDALIVPGMEASFWDAVIGEFGVLLEAGPLVLQNLVAGTPTLEHLALRCAVAGLSLQIEEIERSPCMSLPGSFDEYVEGLDKKARHELRRKMRRAGEALPGISFRVCRDPGEVASAFPAFLDLHRKSHPDKAAFMTEAMAAFFSEVAQRFAEDGTLRLALLSGEPGDVAAAFQIVAGDRLLLYNSGFDPAHRDANAGLVLIARAIERAIAEGFREYDFLRGTERYKYDLGGVDRAVYRATITRA